MDMEQCNKLFDIELRRMQISCEIEELEQRPKSIKKMEGYAVDTVLFMNRLISLLPDVIYKKQAENFVQYQKTKFIMRMVVRAYGLGTGDASGLSDSDIVSVIGPIERFNAEQEDAPLTAAAFLAENNVVDNENGDVAAAVDRIAGRMYKEKYGIDPPKTTTVVPDVTVVETDVYTNAHRGILERACEEYIEQQSPKRRRSSRK